MGSFPDQPEVENVEGEAGGVDGVNGDGATVGSALETSAPLRDLMQAIEIVAARQTRIQAEQWEAWCARLEQALVRMKDQPIVLAAQEIGVNPLAVLRLPPFRPAFCEVDGSAEALLYQETLTRIERRWGVAGMPHLGDGL